MGRPSRLGFGAEKKMLNARFLFPVGLKIFAAAPRRKIIFEKKDSYPPSRV